MLTLLFVSRMFPCEPKSILDSRKHPLLPCFHLALDIDLYVCFLINFTLIHIASLISFIFIASDSYRDQILFCLAQLLSGSHFVTRGTVIKIQAIIFPYIKSFSSTELLMFVFEIKF